MAKSSELHKTHPDIVKRLKRAEGHLRSIVAMIEEGRPCLDIAQQLHAVEKAVAQAKKTLVHDHIDHCLEHAAERPARRAEVARGIQAHQQIPVARQHLIAKVLDWFGFGSHEQRSRLTGTDDMAMVIPMASWTRPSPPRRGAFGRSSGRS